MKEYIRKNKIIERTKWSLPIFLVLLLGNMFFIENKLILSMLLMSSFAFSLMVSDIMIEPKYERKDKLSNYFHAGQPIIIKTVKVSLLIVLMLYFNKNIIMSEDMVIRDSQELLKTTVPFLFFIYVILKSIVVIFNKTINIPLTIEKIIINLTLFMFILWSLGQYGNDIKEYFYNNTNEAISLAIVVFSFMFMSYFSKLLDNKSPHPNIASYNQIPIAKATLSNFKERDTKDMEHTAAHEIGHAMFFAMLGDKLPSNVEVVIKKYRNSNTLGYVTGFSLLLSDQDLRTKEDTEWLMMGLLAGKEGEKFVKGNGIGSTDDHKKWIREADNYLSNCFKGVYYVEPKNDLELEFNNKQMDILRNNQIEKIQDFFEQNRSVFIEMYELLIKNGRLDKDDLTPYLKKVKILSYMPVPNAK